MKHKIIAGILIIPILGLSSIASTYADFDCSSVDRETMREIMEKEKNGDTLSSYETELLENAKACMPEGGQQMGQEKGQGGQMGGVNQVGNKQSEEFIKIEDMKFYDDLDGDIKDDIAELKEDFISDMDDLREEYGETNQLDEDEREELMEDLQELKEAYIEDLEEILEDNDDALEELSQRVKVEGVKKIEVKTQKTKRVVKNLSTQMKTSITSAVVKISSKYDHLFSDKKISIYETLQESLEDRLEKIQDSNKYTSTQKSTYEDVINELLNQLDDKIDELD